MSLVRVFSPQTESEVAVVTALLEAHEIPVFVHGRYLGSVLPGLQINGYNTQSIMVPEECVPEAAELLAEFRRPALASSEPPFPWTDQLRILFEGMLLGWFVPGRSRGEGSRGEKP